MTTARPFAYNTGAPIAGTTQVGNLSVGTPTSGITNSPIFWNGPDEDLGYVIAVPVSGNTQPTPVFSGAPSGKLTLSPTYIGNSMNLSNGNQTVHQFFGYVQSVLGQTLINNNDKVMFSVFCSLDAPATFPNGHYVGIGTTSMNYNGVTPDPYNSYPGNDNQSVGLNSGGEYWYNGTIQASGLPTWTSGDTIDVAVSVNNSKIWIRVNGGNWNNSPTDNPATGTGGQGILGGLTSFYPVLCPSYEGTMTILNNATYGVPSGFTLLGTNITASVRFLGTKNMSNPLNESTFVELTNNSFNQSFTNGNDASTWLTSNGYWNSWVTISVTPTPTPTSTTTPTITPTNISCLNIATNAGGGLDGFSVGGQAVAMAISANPAVGTTYPIGSFITFQNGEVRTLVGIDDYGAQYDVFYDSPISTSILFPITICYPSIPTSTPTPSVTNTQTPTITPTPSTTPSNVTGYSFNLVVLPYNYPTSGNTIMVDQAVPSIGTTNPNVFATNNNGIYFNAIDTNGVNRTSYFASFTGQSITLTISQTGSTAIYSGDSKAFQSWSSGGDSGFTFGYGIAQPGYSAGTTSLIQSASTTWVTGQTVTISAVVNGAGVTPTPTATSVTPTPTPTSGATSDGWFFYYADNGPVVSPPANNGNTAFIPGAGLGTYNPNYTGGTLNMYFNNNNSAGTSYASQFSTLDTAGGTMTISQGSNTVIYSGTSTDYQSSGTFLYLTVSRSAQMIQSAATPFVSGSTINVVVS